MNNLLSIHPSVHRSLPCSRKDLRQLSPFFREMYDSPILMNVNNVVVQFNKTDIKRFMK